MYLNGPDAVHGIDHNNGNGTGLVKGSGEEPRGDFQFPHVLFRIRNSYVQRPVCRIHDPGR